MDPIIDTHTHMCDAGFDADREQVLLRAQRAGISAIVAVSETLEDAQKNLTLGKQFSMLRPAAGLYPTHLEWEAADHMVDFIRRNRTHFWAIGEVGLDYWQVKAEDDRERQRQIFDRFIDLSLETDLPLNVHSRSAGRHAIGLLLERGARRVQLHAFDGKASAALPGVEAGYLFSIPPSVIRSTQKQKLVRNLPLTSLLVETDSPVLGPDPQARNEPANVRVAIKAVSELKSVPESELIHILFRNTQRLYGQGVS
ncbi:MAG: TatD family hydrolase [Deltaproteobacteria bacterium]|nr:TatD family hydrolase [Deltaproteobacteria bacterium]